MIVHVFYVVLKDLNTPIPPSTIKRDALLVFASPHLINEKSCVPPSRSFSSFYTVTSTGLIPDLAHFENLYSHIMTVWSEISLKLKYKYC